MQYAEERKLYEDRVGARVASRYWKCLHCGHRGQVFDNLGDVMATRQRLKQLEDTVADSLGSVARPIGADEPPTD